MLYVAVCADRAERDEHRGAAVAGCPWQARSPGNHESRVAGVQSEAEAMMDGCVDYREQGVRVGPSAFGLGVFSLGRFPLGKWSGRSRAEIFDGDEYESDYCMALGENSALEPDAPFRFLNHSCQPNCALLEYEVEYDDGTDGSELWLTVEADIEPGEQMTIDYGWPAKRNSLRLRQSRVPQVDCRGRGTRASGCRSRQAS